MKRIALFIFVLLLLFSTSAFAQEEITYEVGGYFTVTFPEEGWIISNDGKQGFLLARRQHGYPNESISYLYPKSKISSLGILALLAQVFHAIHLMTLLMAVRSIYPLRIISFKVVPLAQ